MSNEFLRSARETAPVSDEALLLRQYFVQSLNDPALDLENYLLERFGLLNRKRPEKSKMFQMTNQPWLAQRTLNNLASTGNYPKSVILSERANVIEGLERKYRQQVLLTTGWRLFRYGTIATPGLMVIRDAIEAGTLDPGSIVRAMAPATAIVIAWVGINHATAYPQRKLREVAAERTDQRIFRDPRRSESLGGDGDETTVSAWAQKHMTYDEKYPERQRQVDKWLDEGKSPQAVVEILSSRRPHTPFRISDHSAETHILKEVKARIDNLKPPDCQEPRWDTEDAFHLRIEARQKIARQIMRSAYISF